MNPTKSYNLTDEQARALAELVNGRIDEFKSYGPYKSTKTYLKDLRLIALLGGQDLVDSWFKEKPKWAQERDQEINAVFEEMGDG